MPDFADPFSIRLTRRQMHDLTSLSAYDGLSRQELIRRGIDFYLEDRRRALLAQVNNQAGTPAGPASHSPAATPAPAPASHSPVATPAPAAVASSANRPAKVARR